MTLTVEEKTRRFVLSMSEAEATELLLHDIISLGAPMEPLEIFNVLREKVPPAGRDVYECLRKHHPFLTAMCDYHRAKCNHLV